jgi:hypothetical protein
MQVHHVCHTRLLGETFDQTGRHEVIMNVNSPYPRRQTHVLAGDMSQIFIGTELKWQHGKNPIIPTSSWSRQRFCMVCMLPPPIPARVPAMTKIISDSSPVRELNVNESRNYQRLCITYICASPTSAKLAAMIIFNQR